MSSDLKRIVLVLPELDRGGPTLGALALTREWVAQSLDVRVVVLGRQSHANTHMRELLDQVGVPVVFLEAPGWGRLPLALIRLRACITSQRVDVVMSFGLRPDLLNVCIPKRALRVSSVRALLRKEYTYRFGPLLGHFYAFVHIRALKALTHVIVMTQAMRQELVAATIDPSRVTKIPNAVDTAFVRARALQSPQATLPTSVAGGLDVAFVGSLIPRKRPEDLVHAISNLVRRDCRSVRLHLFGDGPLRGAIESIIQSEHLERYVHLYGFRNDLIPLLGSMSACVLPSGSEGTPRAILEAMTLGKTCVVADYPGVHDLIDNGRTGWVYPVGDVKALSDILERIYHNGPLPPEPIREHIDKRFDSPVVAKETRHLLQDLWHRHGF